MAAENATLFGLISLRQFSQHMEKPGEVTGDPSCFWTWYALGNGQTGAQLFFGVFNEALSLAQPIII